jgi:hypothetical protein
VILALTRSPLSRSLLALVATFGLLALAIAPVAAAPGGGPPDHARAQGPGGGGPGGPPDHAGGPPDHAGGPEVVRFGTYNTAFSDPYRADDEGQFLTDLESGNHAPMEDIAQIIQLERPDVLQLGEFDYVGHIDGVDEYDAVDAFRDNYLEVSQDGAEPIEYEYAYVAPSNTGIDSGFDLNRDGQTGTPDDAWGFGFYEGQYGMLVLSKYPILEDEIRTFQEFRWADMPGALLPSDPETDEEGDWYSDEILEEFRLSSKSHWDVPVEIGNHVVHTLNAHPTPPAFDGEEQRNVLRNHDEIRLWADYVHPARGDYLYDDDGETGGLDPGSSFVILGDYNADPCVGDSVPGAIEQLLDHPMVNDRNTPSSEGAVERHAEANDPPLQRCEPEPQFHTADFGWTARVDYALPSNNLQIVDSNVFWPTSDEPLAEVAASSDHHLVSVDLRVPTRGGR